VVANPDVPERHMHRGAPGRGGRVRKCLLHLKKTSFPQSSRLPAPSREASIDIRARGARAFTCAPIGHGTIGQRMAETKQDLMT